MPTPRIPRRTYNEPLRFAHPFIDRGAATHNAARAAAAGGRMREFVTQFLHRVPPPRSIDPVALGSLIGDTAVASLAATGEVVFHLVGDTGVGDDSAQTRVADAMTRDYNGNDPDHSPALMLHGGDVIYGPHKAQRYRDQFYSPYKHYPGKIVSIPGNHDGDVYPETDPTPLKAWLEHFCSTEPQIPEVAGEIFRETMVLPGAYWFLDTPFAQVIGLYSNKLENPGRISGPEVGPHQRQTLVRWLRDADARKALFIMVHHPPYSSGGHAGSPELNADLDAAFGEAQRWPDLILSAHSHSYQRYIRRGVADGPGGRDLPYVVLGCSGKGNQSVAAFDQTPEDGVDYLAFYRGYGFGRLITRDRQVTLEFVSVEDEVLTVRDRFTVDCDSKRVLER